MFMRRTIEVDTEKLLVWLGLYGIPCDAEVKLLDPSDDWMEVTGLRISWEEAPVEPSEGATDHDLPASDPTHAEGPQKAQEGS